MNRARAATLVLLDASPFYRFCEARLLPILAEYLRGNARITPEVATELRRDARSSRHAGLRYLELAGWPPETASLPAELQIPRSSTCSLRLTHQVAQKGHSAESRKSRTGDRTESDAASSSIDWAACSAVSRAR